MFYKFPYYTYVSEPTEVSFKIQNSTRDFIIKLYFTPNIFKTILGKRINYNKESQVYVETIKPLSEQQIDVVDNYLKRQKLYDLKYKKTIHTPYIELISDANIIKYVQAFGGVYIHSNELLFNNIRLENINKNSNDEYNSEDFVTMLVDFNQRLSNITMHAVRTNNYKLFRNLNTNYDCIEYYTTNWYVVNNHNATFVEDGIHYWIYTPHKFIKNNVKRPTLMHSVFSEETTTDDMMAIINVMNKYGFHKIVPNDDNIVGYDSFGNTIVVGILDVSD